MVSATVGRCRDCNATRRWRSVADPDRIGCWTCWRCRPPAPGLKVDVVSLRRGQPTVLLHCYPGGWDEARLVAETVEWGTPIAMPMRALPCSCRQCAPPPAALPLFDWEEV